MSNTQFIISADPGVENFSICVQELDSTTNSLKVVHLELLENTIKSLLEKAQPSFNDQADFFGDYFNQIFLKYKPKNICMERYQIRGFRASGSAAELINVMLGICVNEGRRQNIPFKLVIASEWKNDFNRKSEIPLKELYKCIKKLPPHCIDSMLIGWYNNKMPKSYYTSENLLKYCSNLKRMLDNGSIS